MTSIVSEQICQREKMLPKVATYEQARNKALEIIGKVDPHSRREPIIGKQGICKGKLVGQLWHGGKVKLRLDHDPTKGPHINVTDFRISRGTDGISIAIPFEGDGKIVKSILKHLNTSACIEHAKTIFQKNNNIDYFERFFKPNIKDSNGI